MNIAANNRLVFSEEQGMILDSAREFCRDKSAISAVRALLESDNGFDEAVWQQMVELGWLGLAIPEEFGGSGLGIGATVPLAESMGRYLLATPFFSTTLAAQLFARAGTSAQKNQWLPLLANGTRASLALLDGEDWGAKAFTATAEASAGKLTLSGEKWYVQDAAVADLFSLREAAARLEFEIELSDSASPGEMGPRWAEILGAATGFQFDPSSFLERLGQRFGVARYLRGRMLAAQLSRELREQFDQDWYRNPRAGPFLGDRFSNGLRFTAAEVATTLGSDRLDADALIASVRGPFE